MLIDVRPKVLVEDFFVVDLDDFPVIWDGPYMRLRINGDFDFNHPTVFLLFEYSGADGAAAFRGGGDESGDFFARFSFIHSH
jgi:hypothetical protein